MRRVSRIKHTTECHHAVNELCSQTGGDMLSWIIPAHYLIYSTQISTKSLLVCTKCFEQCLFYLKRQITTHHTSLRLLQTDHWFLWSRGGTELNGMEHRAPPLRDTEHRDFKAEREHSKVQLWNITTNHKHTSDAVSTDNFGLRTTTAAPEELPSLLARGEEDQELRFPGLQTIIQIIIMLFLTTSVQLRETGLMWLQKDKCSMCVSDYRKAEFVCVLTLCTYFQSCGPVHTEHVSVSVVSVMGQNNTPCVGRASELNRLEMRSKTVRRLQGHGCWQDRF